MACRRFIESIYKVLKARHVEKMKQSNFISIQTDSSTDTGQCDNEAIYVRFLKEGSPVTSYLTIQELEDGTGVGHLNTTDAAIKAAGFPGWKEKTVGLGTDGASVMVGEEMGVAGLLRQEIPWLINVHCLSHILQLAAKDAAEKDAKMGDTYRLLKIINKFYKMSPKAWREFKELATILEVKVWKFKRIGGTRWISHLYQALVAIFKGYSPLLIHLDSVAAGDRATDMMEGSAKWCIKFLNDYSSLLFFTLMRDVLFTLNKLNLELQIDTLTLPKAIRTIDATIMELKRMETNPAQYLNEFLQESKDGIYKGVQLKKHGKDTKKQFDRYV